MNFLSKKIFSAPLFIWFTVFIFVARVLFFAAIFGGVEHDSGWYLGVARNLSERGIYASYTNTIRDEGVGAHPSIHGRFSVQDKDGFVYFPAGVTVGPGYIIPEVIILKLFGNGFWQYRLWPLLSYTVLLVILFFLVWKLGGIFSLILFQMWLWAVPQLTTTFAYEAYAEHIALLYLLIGFLLYWISIKKQKKLWWMFASGLFISFSYITKNLFLLPSLAFIVPFVWECYVYRKHIPMLLSRWFVFAVGGILPIGLFEGYRYFFLISHFGYAGWQGVKLDEQLHFQSNGSGITNLNLSHLDWQFVMKKINIWMNVGINYPLAIWIIFLSLPLVIFKYIKHQWIIIVYMLYTAMMISFLWYVFISSDGWARHAWQGIVLGMVIVSLSAGYILGVMKNIQRKLFFIVFLIIGILSIARYETLELSLFLNQQTIEKWRMNRFITGLEGFPSTPILSLKDQQDLIHFFDAHINKNDRIYYAGWFLNAEASPLVDKVFYTLDRYFTLAQKNPDGGNSYLMFGPYQYGPWSLESPEYLPRKISQLCNKIVYQNPSYKLCALRNTLIYDNPAY